MGPVVEEGGVLEGEHQRFFLYPSGGGIIVRGEKGVHVNLRVIKKAITGFGFGPAPTHLGDIPLRTGIKIMDNGEQTFFKAFIATVDSLKFHLHPVGIRRKDGRRVPFLVFIIPQTVSPVAMEGIEKDTFD